MTTTTALTEVRYSKALLKKLTTRAEHQCECRGCSHHRGRCSLTNGGSVPGLSIAVVLAPIARDRNPKNKAENNLMMVCQECKEHHDETSDDQESLFTLDTLRRGA